MSNLSSIARPYALAAFEYANEHQQLNDWRTFLQSAADVTRNDSVIKLLKNPEISRHLLLTLFQEVLAVQLDTERKNFLILIAENNRFAALPEIAETFNQYYAALEKMSKVRVITAVKAQADFTDKLAKALTARIKREVTLHCEIDPAIVGGAIIHIGDRVIDGSVRGKLARLRNSLSA